MQNGPTARLFRARACDATTAWVTSTRATVPLVFVTLICLHGLECTGSSNGLVEALGSISIDWKLQEATEHLRIHFPTFPGMQKPHTPQSRVSRLGNVSGGAHSKIKYGVGTVFIHKKWKYRGVIVAASPKCEMEEKWIKHMGVDSLPGGGRNQPFYSSLVDVRDRPVQNTYVAQSNIEPVTEQNKGPVVHPEVDDFFDHYDESLGAYVPKEGDWSTSPQDSNPYSEATQ